MRVIMPYFERQQMEMGGFVDTLEPPPDPLRPRMSIHSRRSLTDSPKGAAVHGGVPPLGLAGSSVIGSGSSLGNGSNWEAPAFGASETNSTGEHQSSTTGSTWKFW
jgi:hypothetical protein